MPPVTDQPPDGADPLEGEPNLVRVAHADEIPAGGRKIVQARGRSIGVFNLGDGYVALRNRCPHQGGPLCSGMLLGSLEADGPGEYRHAQAGEIIRCPWHGWEFDLRSGRSLFDPQHVRVRSYPARLAAETYPARRSGDYVVVDVGP